MPEWQRSYSWGSAEVEAFWQDLKAFGERYPGKNIDDEEYFLGSIVLVTGGTTNLLLDGQQRLATATVLLSVLRDARITYNRDAAVRLQTKYITDVDDATDAMTYVLTMNVYDRDFFRMEIQDEIRNVGRPTPTLRSHVLIRKAKEYFANAVTREGEALGGGESAFKWNVRLSNVLCNHMSVVAVSSTDEDNAAAVFETLNDRGIGLSTPDLLRNLLLRRAVDEVLRERIVAAWQQVLAIGEEVNVDEFLRHYWVSKRGDVKSRKLYREIKEAIETENVDSLKFSLDLAEAAAVYRDIVRARDSDPDIQRLLTDIRTLGAKPLYPVLLSAYSVVDDTTDIDNLTRLAKALVNTFVRYNVIGGRETTVMESTLFNVARNLRSDGDVDAAVSALIALTPSSDDFIRQFQIASVNRIASARYILREIEHAKRKTKELVIEGTDRVHVEHIYPQTPAANKWSNHTSMINRLGNLTLLASIFHEVP